MAKLERLWGEHDLDNLEATITQLRRMRDAITRDPLQAGKFIGLVNALFQRESAESVEPQQALKDSETIANAAADFLTARLLHQQTAEKQQIWEHIIEQDTKRYRGYKPATRIGTKTREVAPFILNHLRGLNIDPKYLINWALFVNNDLGYSNIDELLKADLGIFAPLSGDYLLGTIYQKYLAQVHPGTFALKPVALSKDLQTSFFPKAPEGTLAFAGRGELGVFFDVVRSKDIGRVLVDAVRRNYPGSLVHEPNFDRLANLEFQPSKKIKSALGIP